MKKVLQPPGLVKIPDRFSHAEAHLNSPAISMLQTAVIPHHLGAEDYLRFDLIIIIIISIF